MQTLHEAADSIGDNGALRLFVNTYVNFIERARFARREPTESDAAAVDKVVDVILLTWVMPVQCWSVADFLGSRLNDAEGRVRMDTDD
jgi:hypothetical protein